MATINYFNGNLGFFARDFNLYDFDDSDSDTLAVMYYTPQAGGPYNPEIHAWRIEFDLDGFVDYEVTEGPMAGETIPIAGVVTEVRWYNQSGLKIMEVTDIAADIPTLARLLDNGRGYQAWQVLIQGDDVINGSNASGISWEGDDITTGYGRDTVYGNGGDDYISDQGGRDVYFGGDGFDQLSYAEGWFWENPAGAINGIRVDLAAGTVRGPDGQVDTVDGIEGVRGTHLADRFLGNSGNNQFMGLAGVDRFDGAGGFDEVRYDRDNRYLGEDGIKVYLDKGRIIDGFGTTDRVVNIEAVRGTNQRDRMYDDDANNRFRGMEGNDYLSVSGGNDTLNGGAGRDVFVFVGTAFGTDVIEDFSQADRDRIEIAAANGLGDLTFSQDGTTAVIQLNAGSSVRVLNFDFNDFVSGDFIF